MSEPVIEQTEVEAPLSIAEHMSQFGKEAIQEANSAPKSADAAEPTVEPQTDAQKAEHHAAQQKRDEAGKFREGKLRQKSHEAKSRIDALTGRAKAAEEKATQLENELKSLREQRAPVAQIQQAERRVEAAGGDSDDPEPKEDDQKYGGDWTKFIEDRARWSARDEFKKQQAAYQQQQAKQQELTTWQGRLNTTKAKYADFEQVAFSPTTIQPGSIADDFIMHDDSGPEILYHLQKNPQERDALLGLSAREQAKALSLLSQRFASDASGSAETTGSVARRNVVTLPKPPNPVRTEAQRASAIPPSTDGSLSIAEHRRAFARRG